MPTRSSISRWLVACVLGLSLIPALAASCAIVGPVAFLTRIVPSTGGMCGFNQYLCDGVRTERVAVKSAPSGMMCRGEGLFRAPIDFSDILSCTSIPAAFVCGAPRLLLSMLAVIVLASIFLIPNATRGVPVRAGPTPFVSSRRHRLSYLLPRGEPIV